MHSGMGQVSDGSSTELNTASMSADRVQTNQRGEKVPELIAASL